MKVSVVKRKDRDNLVFKITWPDGRSRMPSSGTPRRREAERMAARLEDRLNENPNASIDEDTGMTWNDFVERYKAESLRYRSIRTAEAFGTASSWLIDLCNVHYLADVTASELSRLSGELLKQGKSEQTARTYVARIQAAANWAHTLGLLHQPIQLRLNLVDRSQMPRPLTTEEFERIIQKVPKVAGGYAASWRYIIRGLWLSGLRLGESLNLHWDSETAISVDGIDRAEPRLRIPADQQKGRRTQLYPITPDFAEVLRETPEERREGYVFNPRLSSRHGRVTRSRKTVGDTIAEICRQARVVVSKTEAGTQYATAKHFRHSFGARWAPHISELTLMTLMRHQSIETTRKYYVGIASAETSQKVQAVWAQCLVARLGDTMGDTDVGEDEQDGELQLL